MVSDENGTYTDGNWYWVTTTGKIKKVTWGFFRTEVMNSRSIRNYPQKTFVNISKGQLIFVKGHNDFSVYGLLKKAITRLIKESENGE